MRFAKLFFLTSILFSLDTEWTYSQQLTELLNERFTSFSIGYSPISVFFLGKTPNSQTFYSYIGKAKKMESEFLGTRIYITSGIIPLLAYDYEKRDDGAKKDNVWGAGISPIGLMFKTSDQKRVNFEYGITSGIVYMNKFFPTDRSRRLNYTIDLSISVEKKIFEQSALVFGYKFHHISNAQTGSQNPGIDSNIIFISYKKYRHGN